MSRAPPPPPPPPQPKISKAPATVKISSGSLDTELKSRVTKSEERYSDCATVLYGFELSPAKPLSVCSICKSGVQNEKSHLNFHATPVFSWLYIGSKENSSSLAELSHWGITSIINCTSEVGNSFIDQVEYFNFPIAGGMNNADLLNEASFSLENLRTDRKTVLVHCVQGANRAAGVVLNYLMTYSGMPLRDAYLFIKEKRSSIRLKRYLLEVLIEIELKLFAIKSLDLYELCENEND